MQVFEEVPLAPYTTFQIGGPARWFAEAVSEDDIAAGIAFARERQLPLFILGGGSNLLVSDSGFSGLVLRNGMGAEGMAWSILFFFMPETRSIDDELERGTAERQLPIEAHEA